MRRFALSAVALATMFVTAQPVFADVVVPATSDRAQSAGAVTEQPASPAPVWSPAPDAAGTSGVPGKSFAPAGFGWG